MGGRFGQICRGWVGTSDNMRRARCGIIEGIGGGISLVLISEHSARLKLPHRRSIDDSLVAFQPCA